VDTRSPAKRRQEPPAPASGAPEGASTLAEFLERNRLTVEREWQQQMQEASDVYEQQARARAVKAGEAAARSSKHVSKKRRRGRPSTEEIAGQQRIIRELSAELRATRKDSQ
jgi:hypothetical protein